MSRYSVSGLIKAFLILSVPLASAIAQAMPVKTLMLKPRAYFVEADDNLLEALDLKSKTLTFKKADFDQCGAILVRKAQSLSYSCTLVIPSKAKISRLQNMVTAGKLEVDFGGTKREVQVQVSPDARKVTLSTTFDATGVDFEVGKFNDDIFGVHAKVAQIVISDALHKNPLRIEVLETR